jgi:lipopolysaccharide transport system ATP-binding protein
MTLPRVEGKGRLVYTIPSLPLLEGLYEVSVAVINKDDTEMFDYHDRLYPFRVVKGGKVKEMYGVLTLQGTWDFQPEAGNTPAAERQADGFKSTL